MTIKTLQTVRDAQTPAGDVARNTSAAFQATSSDGVVEIVELTPAAVFINNLRAGLEKLSLEDSSSRIIGRQKDVVGILIAHFEQEEKLPTLAEIARTLGIHKSDVVSLLKGLFEGVGMSRPTPRQWQQMQRIVVVNEPIVEADSSVVKKRLERNLKALTPRRREILKLAFGLDREGEVRTLKEVARLLGLNHSVVLRDFHASIRELKLTAPRLLTLAWAKAKRATVLGQLAPTVSAAMADPEKVRLLTESEKVALKMRFSDSFPSLRTIAHSLHITRQAVSYSLNSAFGKLGVPSPYFRGRKHIIIAQEETREADWKVVNERLKKHRVLLSDLQYNSLRLRYGLDQKGQMRKIKIVAEILMTTTSSVGSAIGEGKQKLRLSATWAHAER